MYFFFSHAWHFKLLFVEYSSEIASKALHFFLSLKVKYFVNKRIMTKKGKIDFVIQ